MGFALCFALAVLASCVLGQGANSPFSRMPYLQIPTPNSMIVRWRTKEFTQSTVWYSTTYEGLNAPDCLTAYDEVAVKEHIVTLTGLQPRTKYYYAVGNRNVLLQADNMYFTTAPDASYEGPLRMWVLGDPGRGSKTQYDVMFSYLRWLGPEQFLGDWLMILGDNVYSSGTDLEYQVKLFDVYNMTYRHLPYYALIGNHDMGVYKSMQLNSPYFLSFSVPEEGEAGGFASKSVYYYSYDFAYIHIAVLDSQISDRSPNGAMAKWLINDLEANTKPWTIVAYHHPAYSKGSHDSDRERQLIEMRQNFGPIIEQFNVDLVLAGHSHSYERSYVMKGHFDTSTTLERRMILDGGTGAPSNPYLKREGTVYVVCGSSGAVGGGRLNHPAMYKSLNVPGSMTVDVDGMVMNVQFIDHNATVLDHFRIVKRNDNGNGNDNSNGNGNGNGNDDEAGKGKRMDMECPLTAIAKSDSEIALNWEFDPRIATAVTDGYQIKRCQGRGCTEYKNLFSVLTTTPIAPHQKFTFTDSNVVPESSYTYVVVWHNREGFESTAPATASTSAPKAPLNVTAKFIGKEKGKNVVMVKWTDMSDNETEFQIEVCRGDQCSRRRSLGANVFEYIDKHMEDEEGGMEYSYRVIARNHVGWAESRDVARVFVE